MPGPNPIPPARRELLLDQARHYDAGAEPYARFVERYMRPVLPRLAALTENAMRDVGSVLELAPGPGTFTGTLSRCVKNVTALDASPAMLAKLAQLGLANVETEEQDLFDWQPDGTRTWDAVFMSNWLAHVPPADLPAFFGTLSTVLAPGGFVIVVDVTPVERFIEMHVGETAGVPIVGRAANDGGTNPVVKKYWRPGELFQFLTPLGWTGTGVRVGDEIDRGFVFYRFHEVIS